MADDGWKRIWDARKSALESALGPADDTVLHAMIPFHLGGQADVLLFHKHVKGRVAATCELLGETGQKKNQLGTYELMISHRDDNDWGPNILSRLARYTCDAKLEPGDTMELGPSVPKGSTIVAFLFVDYAKFKFEGEDAGILLCIGITKDELAACRQGKAEEVFDALKGAGVYPYTEFTRKSVLGRTKPGFWSRLFRSS